MFEESSIGALLNPDRPVYREVELGMRNRAMAYFSEKRGGIDRRVEENDAALAVAREKAEKAWFVWKFFAEQELRSLETTLVLSESDKRLRGDLSNALVDLTTSSARCDRASRLLGYYIDRNLGFVNSIFRAHDSVGRDIAAECEEDAVEAYVCLRSIDYDRAARYGREFGKLAKSHGFGTSDEMLAYYEVARAERMAKNENGTS